MVGLLSPFVDPWNRLDGDVWQGVGSKFALVAAVNVGSSYMVSMSAFWVLGSNSALTHVLIGYALSLLPSSPFGLHVLPGMLDLG